MIRILSLGGGVQSVAVAHMSLRGDLPPLDHVIFADTGAETEATYATVAELERLLTARGVAFHRARAHTRRSSGSLYDDLMSDDRSARWASPPLVIRAGNKLGMTLRQCTSEYKKAPITRKIRELAGIKPRSTGPREVVAEVWLGISLDEMTRMKSGEFRWITYRHPLIERRMTRGDCIRYLENRQIPVPEKSACFFCPFQSDRRWRDLAPGHRAKAIALDQHLRRSGTFKGDVYLHRSGRPLAEVLRELDHAAERQPSFDWDGFEHECAGVCGV